MRKIGFTTSIPVEVILAAGCIPVDLNNIFITGSDPVKYIDTAESHGFPRSTCAWIKGIYSAILDFDDMDMIISVVEGDCSNTRALSEVLAMKGVKSVSFSYPSSARYEALKYEIDNLMNFFGVTRDECLKVKRRLDDVRKKLSHLDMLTWQENLATGFENHLWQVSASDFGSDVDRFEKSLDEEILKIEKRQPREEGARIGYIGVPPICADIYDFIEETGGRVVYNEVQRQFTMAHGIGSEDLTKVYLDFTYPYSLEGRLRDIKEQIRIRGLNGIIHYTQAFCFRGIEDMVIRNALEVPVLTLEGDKPGELDARTKLRIESFIDMISE